MMRTHMLKATQQHTSAMDQIFADKPEEGYRLITRSDMDGLVCAVLLKELDLVGEIDFVHPKDMQDGLIPVSTNDISTNLPFVPGIYMALIIMIAR